MIYVYISIYINLYIYMYHIAHVVYSTLMKMKHILCCMISLYTLCNTQFYEFS